MARTAEKVEFSLSQRSRQRHLRVLANMGPMFLRGRVDWKKTEVPLNSKTSFYNLCFVWIRGKIKMRSREEFAYACFLSIT